MPSNSNSSPVVRSDEQGHWVEWIHLGEPGALGPYKDAEAAEAVRAAKEQEISLNTIPISEVIEVSSLKHSDSLNLSRLTYDSANEHAQFAFNGSWNGKPFNILGALHAPSSGDLQESLVRAEIKEQMKQLLRDCADAL